MGQNVPYPARGGASPAGPAFLDGHCVFKVRLIDELP